MKLSKTSGEWREPSLTNPMEGELTVMRDWEPKAFEENEGGTWFLEDKSRLLLSPAQMGCGEKQGGRSSNGMAVRRCNSLVLGKNSEVQGNIS